MDEENRIISENEEMQLRLLKMADRALDLYADSHDADSAINFMLGEIGELLNVSETYVFELKDNVIQKTYVWNKCSKRLGGTGVCTFKEWDELGLNDITTLSGCAITSPFTGNLNLPAGAYSYLIGNYNGLDKQCGSIVAVDRATLRCWSESESMLLKSAAKMLSLFLIKMRDVDSPSIKKCSSSNEHESQSILTAYAYELPFDPEDYAMRLNPIIDLKSGQIHGAQVSLRWINSKYMPIELKKYRSKTD